VNNDGSPGPDWAEQWVARAAHEGAFVAFLVFWKLEGDGDGLGKGEGEERVVKPECAFVPEEFEVSKEETFCTGLPCDHKVLTGVHCKEEGTPSKLMGGIVECAIILSAEFAKGAGGEQFLGPGRWVAVLVALQLVQ
jgi:hypothetical protein